jgi:outer membrane protein assembly factor BamB
MRESTLTLATLVLLMCQPLVPCLGASERTPYEQQAQEILRSTAVRGGLVVHLGCGDGRLTAGLRAGDSYLVHALDRDAANVRQARQFIMSRGLYGPVSVDQLGGNRLPYVDNFVNLIVSEDLGGVPMAEVMRVLTPNGVAYLKNGGTWTKTVKPWPAEIDEWTHFFHDATGNPVAHDTVVGPPRRYQWIGSPRWSRHHDHMASMSALVSAKGRLFYIVDEGSRASIQLPAKWSLIARDAFNGTVLWKRPIPEWNTHRWPLKSGPAQITRRLAAVGDTVYVTLGLDAPLTALDAATGATLRTYAGTANTEEIIVSDGVVFLLVNRAPSKWPEYRNEFSYVWDNSRHANTGWPWDKQPRRIVAVDAGSDKSLWRVDATVAPLTLAADSKRVYFHNGERIVSINRANRRQAWESAPVPTREPMPVCFGPRLLVWQDVVVCAGGTRKMTAVSADTGKTLWTGDHPRSGHRSPEDLFVVNGLVWSGQIANTADSGIFKGLDPHTGQVKKQFPPDVKIYWFHHRCYPSKATDRYLMTSRNGTEFIDYEKETWEPHHWVRGGCIYGVLPSNGLMYAPPHSCGCYLEAKLCGFNAMAPESPAVTALRQAGSEGRLERGPAYDADIDGGEPGTQVADWPTYRHDGQRSGRTKAIIPAELKHSWQMNLGGRLSSVVVAGASAVAINK